MPSRPCATWATTAAAEARAWVGDLLEFLAPSACLPCGRPGFDVLCPACEARLSLPPGPACLRCGMPWRLGGGCGRCARFGRPFAFGRALGLWVYAGPVRRLVHGFKYGGRRDVLVPLGRRMAESPRLGSIARAARDGVIVHVPARGLALRRRGYDQAAGLADGVARALGRPHEASALVRRREPPDAQAGRSVTERRRHVRATFVARRRLVDDRNVLLVDDVLSTGASADAASRALLLAGARDVTVLTLAT